MKFLNKLDGKKVFLNPALSPLLLSCFLVLASFGLMAKIPNASSICNEAKRQHLSAYRHHLFDADASLVVVTSLL
jgi:hypothetical protein